MPVSLTVHVDEAQLSAILTKLGPQLYRPAVAELLQQAALLGERVARQGAPRDTGALQRSILHQTAPLAARVYSTLAYAPVQEAGRRAGARMPPSKALHGWLSRHGIDVRLAFVVARAIGRRGLRGRFFMQAGARAVTAALPRLASDAAAKIERLWGGR